MEKCLFCGIINGTIPAKIIYRDDMVLAFEDINPQAPNHILVVPQQHIATLNDLDGKQNELIGYLIFIAAKIAKDLDIADDGYRLVLNCNPGAGQTVFHIHLHLLGGRKLTWPPG